MIIIITMSSGAISLMVKMLRTEQIESIKKYCASTLFCLSSSNDNCYIMLDSEALLPVIELTQTDYINTKVLCAGIISRLSLHRQYYDQFAKGNVLKVLLSLSEVNHRLTQRRVVVALVNLSQDEKVRQLLIGEMIIYFSSIFFYIFCACNIITIIIN